MSNKIKGTLPNKNFFIFFVLLLIFSFSNLHANENNFEVFSVDMLFLDKSPLENNYANFLSSSNNEFDELERYSRLSTIHDILGYTTVALGILTGILNPNIVDDSLHEALGYVSAGMSAVTLGFGFAAHHDQLNLDSGLNSNVVHAVLGISGGVMMMLAPFLAPDDAHAALGILGTGTMGLSIFTKLVF